MPLFEDFNPYAPYQPQAAPQLQILPGAGGPRPPAIPALDPQQEDGMLQKLLGTAGSGVSYAAGSLDKAFGGRAIRGLLGGHPEELLSAVPFSDTLGLSHESNRVSGEDLAKQWGLLDGDGEKGTFEARDLVGPAIEMATDPGSYLSFGGSALSHAGLDAAKAGKLEGSLLGRIKAGQGGLVGLGLPFSHPAAVLGTGETAQKVAGKLGGLYDAAAGSLPGRALGAMFDTRVDGTTSKVLQPELRAVAPDFAAKQAGIRGNVAGIAQDLKTAGELNPQTSPVIRGALEGTVSPLPDTATQRAVEQIRQLLAEAPGREASLGIDSKALPDYAPRQATGVAGEGFRGATQPVSPFNPHQIGREDFLDNTHVVGKTAGLNALARDAELRAMPTLQRQQVIRQSYLAMDPGEDALRFQLNDWFKHGQDLSPEQAALRETLNAKWAQAEGLANWAPTLPKELADKQLDFFGNHVLNDVQQRLVRGAKSETRADAFLSGLAKHAGPIGEETVPVMDVVKAAGLTPEAARPLMQKMGVSAPELLDRGVPQEVAKELTRYVQGVSTPEAIKPFLNAFDAATRMFKAGVTTAFPAKYTRDFLQGAFMNWVHDIGNPSEMLKAYQDAQGLVRSGRGVLADANRIPGLEHLTGEEASRQLLKEMYAHGVAGPDKLTAAKDAFGGDKHAAEKAMTLAGDRQPSAGDVLGTLAGRGDATWNPIKAAKGEAPFAPAVASRQTMEAIDDLNRGAIYIAKRRQGFSPEAAASVTNKAQYDYGNLTGFERSVMQRAMPFYNFMRQNIPAQLSQLVEKPGGKLAVGLKGTNALRHDQGFVPSNIGEGLAVPVGGESQDGTRRFLSHFGLPFEEAFGDIGTGPHAVGRTLQNLISETNPLIKGPIELATGKQMMSGRNLDDLYGSTGSQVLDQLLYNGPLSRFVTTGRTLLDDRKDVGTKAMNLLSPVKATDVNVDRSRTAAAREMIDEMLSGNQNVGKFERLYVRPGQAGSLSPRDLALMELYQSMERQQKKKGP